MEEYTRQGKPTIGQRQYLSRSDIVKASQMYNCPESGVPGHHRILLFILESKMYMESLKFET